MNKPLIKWLAVISTIIGFAISMGALVYAYSSLENAKATLSYMRAVNCDLAINLPKSDSGGVIDIEDLINCQQISDEKLAEAEYNLSHRAEWYLLISDNPFHVWYKGELFESDHQENTQITEDWPYKRKIVFYTWWSDLDKIDGVKLMGCDKPITYPTVQDNTVYIYPCSK